MSMKLLSAPEDCLFRDKGQKKRREPNPGFDRTPHPLCRAGVEWRCLQRALWAVTEGGGESGENGDPEVNECEIFRNDVVVPRTTSRPRTGSLRCKSYKLQLRRSHKRLW